MSHQPPGLPLSLIDLVETLDEFEGRGTGMRVALKLMAAFGGRDVKFPLVPAPDHPVAKALGLNDALALCRILDNHQIYIPHARSRRRRASIMDMQDRGMTRAQIAAALDLSERHVRHLANNAAPPVPLPLFPDED